MVWLNISYLMVMLIFCRQIGSQNITQVNFQSDGIGSTDSMLDIAPGTLPEMTQFTVCARLFLHQAAEALNPFTSYVAIGDNDMLLGTIFASQSLQIACCQDHINFEVPLPVKLHIWQHTCIALNLETNRYWIAFDDIFKEGNLEADISGPLKVPGGGRLSIGQERDVRLDGGFRLDQSFYGSIAQYQLFSKALNPSFMKDYVHCRDLIVNLQPVLSFRNMSAFIVKGSTVMQNKPLSKLCKQLGDNDYHILPKRITFLEAQTCCLGMGGSLALPTNEEENTQIWKQAVELEEYCTGHYQTMYWLGARGDLLTKRWLRLNDSKEIDWENLPKHKYRNVTEQNGCLSVGDSIYPYMWYSTSCEYLTCPLCNISRGNILTVRGLCADTFLDRLMTIYSSHNHKPVIYGMYNTIVRWSNEYSAWLMTSRNHKDLTGIMKMEAADTYPFGINYWNLTGDKCAGGIVKVMITSCNPETEITCTDGTCISKSQRCNMAIDCSDQSDEIDCNLTEVPLSYATNLPPPKSEDTLLPIIFSIEITSVRHIDILGFKIGLDIGIYKRWRDDRILMKNLKNNKWANKVQDHTKLWKPNVQITDGSKSLVDVDLRSESMMVLKEGTPLPDNPSRLNEDLYYSGSENTLLLYHMITAGFTCQFELQRYPFDTQACSILFSLLDLPGDYALLKKDGDGVIFSGQKKLLEYMVTKVNMTFVNISDNMQGQMVTIELKNLYGYYISSTYVPTILLVIICYMTLFFDIEDFSDRVMVSLTSLLVLAALFSQTSQTIPKTAYLKLIDIWFVSIIILVFFIILLIVIIERLRLRRKCMNANSKKKMTMVHPIKEKGTFSDLGLNFPSNRISPYKDPYFVNFVAQLGLPIIIAVFLIVYGSTILQ